MICTCCGRYMETKENAVKGVTPYPFDSGYGLCLECEEWSFKNTFTPIIEKVRESLNFTNKERFDAMSFDMQAKICSQLVEEGKMQFSISR